MPILLWWASKECILRYNPHLFLCGLWDNLDRLNPSNPVLALLSPPFCCREASSDCAIADRCLTASAASCLCVDSNSCFYSAAVSIAKIAAAAVASSANFTPSIAVLAKATASDY